MCQLLSFPPPPPRLVIGSDVLRARRHRLSPDLINSIAPNVSKVRASRRFFEALDDQLCPADPAQLRLSCAGTYVIATEFLTRCGFGPEEVAEITQVLASRGACCDCETLFNVAEESSLKSQYWKARAAGLTPPDSHCRHLGA